MSDVFLFLPKTLLVDIDIFIVEKRKSKTVSSKLLLDQKVSIASPSNNRQKLTNRL